MSDYPHIADAEVIAERDRARAAVVAALTDMHIENRCANFSIRVYAALRDFNLAFDGALAQWALGHVYDHVQAADAEQQL